MSITITSPCACAIGACCRLVGVAVVIADVIDRRAQLRRVAADRWRIAR
jgi:hypothetical protein